MFGQAELPHRPDCEEGRMIRAGHSPHYDAEATTPVLGYRLLLLPA